jgi:hypothetical protein
MKNTVSGEASWKYCDGNASVNSVFVRLPETAHAGIEGAERALQLLIQHDRERSQH